MKWNETKPKKLNDPNLVSTVNTNANFLNKFDNKARMLAQLDFKHFYLIGS